MRGGFPAASRWGSRGTRSPRKSTSRSGCAGPWSTWKGSAARARSSLSTRTRRRRSSRRPTWGSSPTWRRSCRISRRPFAREARARRERTQREVDREARKPGEHDPVLGAPDVLDHALGVVREEKAQRDGRGNEDRAARGLGHREARGGDPKRARREEGDDAKAEEEAGEEDRARAVASDRLAHALEALDAEEPGEARMGDQLGAVAAPDEIDDPVRDRHACEADGDHRREPEHALLREHARADQRDV